MRELKYFKEGKTNTGYGGFGLVLHDIFSLLKDKKNIEIREECDGYFYKTLTKEQAVELLQEGIDWILSENEE